MDGSVFPPWKSSAEIKWAKPLGLRGTPRPALLVSGQYLQFREADQGSATDLGVRPTNYAASRAWLNAAKRVPTSADTAA